MEKKYEYSKEFAWLLVKSKVDKTLRNGSSNCNQIKNLKREINSLGMKFVKLVLKKGEIIFI